MLVRTGIVCVLLIASGCGSKSGDGAGSSSSSAEDGTGTTTRSSSGANAGDKPALDWQKRTDKPFDAPLQWDDGELATITLTLVDGFTTGTPGVKGAAAFLLKDEKNDAEVRIHLSPVKEVESVESIRTAWEEDKGKILKAEGGADGVVATASWDGRIRAKVVRKVGDRVVECTGSSASPYAVKNADIVLPWLEKLCSSMKSK